MACFPAWCLERNRRKVPAATGGGHDSCSALCSRWWQGQKSRPGQGQRARPSKADLVKDCAGYACSMLLGGQLEGGEEVGRVPSGSGGKALGQFECTQQPRAAGRRGRCDWSITMHACACMCSCRYAAALQSPVLLSLRQQVVLEQQAAPGVGARPHLQFGEAAGPGEGAGNDQSGSAQPRGSTQTASKWRACCREGLLQPSDLKAGKRPLTNGRFRRTATARRPQPTHEETLWCHVWLPAHKSSMSGSAPCKAPRPGAQVMAAFNESALQALFAA